MKQTYAIQYGKETWQELQEIGRFGYAMSEVFSDFLDVCLNTVLSLTDNAERYPAWQLLGKLLANELDGEYCAQRLEL